MEGVMYAKKETATIVVRRADAQTVRCRTQCPYLPSGIGRG